MPGVFRRPLLAVTISNCSDEIVDAWRAEWQLDAEFCDVELDFYDTVSAISKTLRNPQNVTEGPDGDWNQFAVDFVNSVQSIGIVCRSFRYLAVSVENVVLLQLPEEERLEALMELHRAINFACESAARAAAKDISEAVYHSHITALRNRLALERDLKEKAEAGNPYQLAFVDMDGLKIINDRDGHNAGDRALKDLAVALSGECAEFDAAYHFHGDEFGVVTECMDDGYLEELLDRARVISSSGFSYGVARQGEAEDIFALLGVADKRMAEDKKARKKRGEAPERPS